MSEVFRTVSEEADFIRQSEKSIRRKAAELGAIRIGSRLIFPESDTLRYLEKQRLAPRGRRRV